ncbi:MAG TPA: Mut7-C RNAse domain-containing protein [Methanothrix sp.]|nr:Mut7-C RNAse domain-containing protein [Methanothrix sp.]HOK57425.1 Mut7-C RNAse domain-containing protein [Methanothrix sp.]HOL42721.1 Mut7-C RNAse domain-containing protein [Methanothrix sp.]HPO87710.1 Mut7-C RNAse domain-containing protein [Methanothrix sp.]
MDHMLMRLGRWLRLAGHDVENPRSMSDGDLIAQAGDRRTLLTRDRSLAELCERAGVRCILIRSSHIDDQLREVQERGINLGLNPERCTICNGELLDMGNGRWMCSRCGKIYWQGSHWRGIEARLRSLGS